MFSRLHQRRSNLQDLGRLSKSCPTVDNEQEPEDSDGSENSSNQSWESAASLSDPFSESGEEVAAPVSRAEKQLVRRSLRQSKQREVQQKRNIEQNKISMDDYLGKQAQFRVWLLEEQKKQAKDLPSPKLKTYFKLFVRMWNKRHLPEKYYESRLSWTMEGDATSRTTEKQCSPLGCERVRFSLMQNSPVLDTSLFPHTIDLSPANMVPATTSSTSSFSTFGKSASTTPHTPFRFTGAGSKKALSEHITAGIDQKGVYRFGENKENAVHMTKSATLPATLTEDLRTATISPHKKMLAVCQDRSLDRVSVSWSPRGPPKLNPVFTPHCPSRFPATSPTHTPSRSRECAVGKDTTVQKEGTTGCVPASDVLPPVSVAVYHQVKDFLPEGTSPIYAEIPSAENGLMTINHSAAEKVAAKGKAGQRRRSHSVDEMPVYAVVTPRAERVWLVRPLSKENSVSPPPIPPKCFDPHVEGLGIPFSAPPAHRVFATSHTCQEGMGGEDCAGTREGTAKKSSKPFKFPWFGKKLTSRRRSRSCEVLSPSVQSGEGCLSPCSNGLFPLVQLERSPTLTRRILTQPLKPPGQQCETSKKHQVHSLFSSTHTVGQQPDMVMKAKTISEPQTAGSPPDMPHRRQLDVALSPASPATRVQRQIMQVSASPHRLQFELMDYNTSPMRLGGAGRGRFAAQGERSKGSGGGSLRRRSRSLEHVACAGMKSQVVNGGVEKSQVEGDLTQATLVSLDEHSDCCDFPPPPSSWTLPVSADTDEGASDSARTAGCQLYDDIKSEVHSGLSSLVHKLSSSRIAQKHHSTVKKLETSPKRPDQILEPQDPRATEPQDPPTTEPQDPPTTEPQDPPTTEPQDPPTEPQDPPTIQQRDLNNLHYENTGNAEGLRHSTEAHCYSSQELQAASRACADGMEDREKAFRQPVPHSSGGNEQHWTPGTERPLQHSSGRAAGMELTSSSGTRSQCNSIQATELTRKNSIERASQHRDEQIAVLELTNRFSQQDNITGTTILNLHGSVWKASPQIGQTDELQSEGSSEKESGGGVQSDNCEGRDVQESSEQNSLSVKLSGSVGDGHQPSVEPEQACEVAETLPPPPREFIEFLHSVENVHNTLQLATPLRELSDPTDTDISLYLPTPVQDRGNISQTALSLPAVDCPLLKSFDLSSAVRPITTIPQLQQTMVCETPSQRQVVHALVHHEDVAFSVRVPLAQCLTTVGTLASARMPRGLHHRRSHSLDGFSSFRPMLPDQTYTADSVQLAERGLLPSTAPSVGSGQQMMPQPNVDETQPVYKQPPSVPNNMKILTPVPAFSHNTTILTLKENKDPAGLVLLKPVTSNQTSPAFRETETTASMGETEAILVVAENEVTPAVSVFQQQFGGSVRPVTRSHSHRRRSRSVGDTATGSERGNGGVAGEGVGVFASVRAFWDSLRGDGKAGGAEKGGSKGGTLQRKPSTMRRLQQQLFGVTDNDGRIGSAPHSLSAVPHSPPQHLKVAQQSPLKKASVCSSGVRKLASLTWAEGQRMSDRAKDDEGQRMSDRAKDDEGQRMSDRAKDDEGQRMSDRAKDDEGQRMSDRAKDDEGQPGVSSDERMKMAMGRAEPLFVEECRQQPQAGHTLADRVPDSLADQMKLTPAKEAEGSPAQDETVAGMEQGEGKSPAISPFVTVRRRSTRKKSVVSETVTPVSDDHHRTTHQEHTHLHTPASNTSTTLLVFSVQTESLERPYLGMNSIAAKTVNQSFDGIDVADLKTTSTLHAATLSPSVADSTQADRGSNSRKMKPQPPPRLLPKPDNLPLLKVASHQQSLVNLSSAQRVMSSSLQQCAASIHLRTTRKRHSDEQEHSGGWDKQRAVATNKTPQIRSTPPHHQTSPSTKHSYTRKQAEDLTDNCPTSPPTTGVTNARKRRSGDRQVDQEFHPVKRCSSGGKEKHTPSATGRLHAHRTTTTLRLTGDRHVSLRQYSSRDGSGRGAVVRQDSCSSRRQSADRGAAVRQDSGGSRRQSAGRGAVVRQDSGGSRRQSAGRGAVIKQDSGRRQSGTHGSAAGIQLSTTGQRTVTRTDSQHGGTPVRSGSSRQQCLGQKMLSRTDSDKQSVGQTIVTSDKHSVGQRMVTSDKQSIGQTIVTSDKQSVGQRMVTRTDSNKQSVGQRMVTRTDSDKQSVGQRMVTRTDSNKQSVGQRTVTRTDSDKQSVGQRTVTRTDSDRRQSIGRGTAVVRNRSSRGSGDGVSRQHRPVISTLVHTYSSARRRSSGVGAGGGATPTSKLSSVGKLRRDSNVRRSNSSTASSRNSSFRRQGGKPSQSPTFLRISRHLGVSQEEGWEEGAGQHRLVDEEQEQLIIAGLQKTMAEMGHSEAVMAGSDPKHQPPSHTNTSTAQKTAHCGLVTRADRQRMMGQVEMETDLDSWEDDDSTSPTVGVCGAPFSTMV